MLLLSVGVLCSSILLTECVRQYANRYLLDIPNERSSHVIVTARGGGLGFVLVFLAVVLYLCFLRELPLSLALACVSTGSIVAFIGFIDDHWAISARFRLLMHGVALGIGLYCLGGLSSNNFISFYMSNPYLLNAFGLIALVWLLNLYNFMDGINGLAATQAILFCFAAAGFFYQYSAIPEAMTLLILGLSVSGFLCFNFPRALIFMGDVGSGFLGAILALFFVRALQIDFTLFSILLILLAVFIVDANLTLVRRALRREALMQAHRSHAYQFASRRFGHTKVTISFVLIMGLYLYPLAIFVSRGYIQPIWGVCVAYAPLIALAALLQNIEQNK